MEGGRVAPAASVAKGRSSVTCHGQPAGGDGAIFNFKQNQLPLGLILFYGLLLPAAGRTESPVFSGVN